MPATITAAILVAAIFTIASTTALNITPISFDEGYTPLFGERNIVRSPDGRTVKIHLNQYSGSGFISSSLYYHGLFGASIKLPSDYTAGVVVAFYMSNGDIFEKNHDELDFEFLGNVKGKQWRIQTNVYGNGSTNRGREERYLLPFDPTAEAHHYSVLWTNTTIIFYIDEIPIREVARTEAMGGDFPSKPMSLYATIWDASDWATSGGKYRVDYKYSPFVSDFSNFILQGCRLDPIRQLPPAAEQCRAAEDTTAVSDYAVMTAVKRAAMREFRQRFMTYSFCYDELRYPKVFPDCDVVESEKNRFWKSGDAKIRRRGRWRRSRGERVRSRMNFKGHDDE
ncbi:probable xyloglucan endotransglucosylase/hydrolase protein 30 [Phalaenopsis equestris]|uniref:probable xyloglucan endotransglucosylase/hydrolase protein 30 n=1 Tax=Phalaenopsis equestris TaxID=78828 RepID=UPI0009E4590F|nr:probable xyloglucan endotransglucosylase/hydrolase protein 30 [Phalaenopsis equestris]XP_020571998.1 probable xyloglucan endotransglucosylase/hydrolase protein 30 [Phalaenopsis equestris]